MIIETDFLDHWKTQMLIKLTGSDAAPLLMLRFWGFCQQRRAWRFPGLSDEALAAICRWSGEPARLRTALVAAGFLVEEQDESGRPCLVAHDFEKVHSNYVTNWKNGQFGHLGGRPKKPTDNPPPPQRVQSANPLGEERRGEDRRGSEGSTYPQPPPAGASRKRSAKSSKRDRIPSVIPSATPEPRRTRMLELNAILRRPPTDAWSGADQLALDASGLLAMAEPDFAEACATVRAYYHATIPREISAKYWKRSTLEKLLENWGGELDKARAWAREQSDGIRKV